MKKPSINIYSKKKKPVYLEPSPGNSGLDLCFDLPYRPGVGLPVVPKGDKLIWDTGLIFDLTNLPDMMGEVPIVWDICVHIRSSVSIKEGLILANQVGIIDQSYNGPEDTLKVALRYEPYPQPPHTLYAEKDSYTLEDGKRAVQLVVRMAVDWSRITLTHEKPTGTSRGGVGSTGA